MANIFYSLLQPPRSVIDFQNEYALADQRANQNALTSLALQTKKREDARAVNAQNALQRIAAGWNANTTDEQRVNDLLNSGLPELASQADALRTSALKRTETEAKAKKDNADAGKTTFETDDAKRKAAIQHIGAFQTANEAAAALQATPDIPPPMRQALLQSLQATGGDPLKFRDWQLRVVLSIASPKEQSAGLAPNISMSNTGGALVATNTNPLAGPVGAVAGVTPVRITQSPDNAATNATSRANNAATIAKDLQVAGIQPGGGLDDNSERTAQAIASGQLPAPTGMALLNPKNQRILGRVMEINPQYDSTTVDAKKKAARDFSTGQQGNAMRSFAVAGDHLDQLGKLVDALDNGDLQVVNKVGNIIREQTGSPAPTNFDAAKDVVSKEVVKAIVAGGGGVAERQELSDLMSKAKSPAQLKGVITQYRSLMAAQHDALLQQRRAAGLPDSTLPDYRAANPKPASGGVLRFDAQGNPVK